MQVAQNLNSNDPPRDDHVKRFLENMKRNTAQRNRENYTDRGVATILDGYSTLEQLAQIIAAAFQGQRYNKVRGLRDAAAFALSHALVLRGDNIRNIELSNVFVSQLQDEGPQCMAMLASVFKSKTNKVGNMDLSASIRHRDVLCCSHGWIALYLFARWNDDDEPFPDFTNNASWFDLKLFASDNSPTVAIKTQTHIKIVTRMLNRVGLEYSSKKTHITRGSAARMAELSGVPEDQIRRMGHWNQESMERNYLTCIPRKAMRALSGM
jgi:hypothetical protein